MDDVKKDQTPSSVSPSVGVGSKEAGQIAQIERLLKSSEGPVLTSEVQQAGVELVPDHTLPPVPAQAQVQVEVPEPSFVRPQTLTQAYAMLSKAGDVLVPFKDFLLVSLRQIKRQLMMRAKTQASNP